MFRQIKNTIQQAFARVQLPLIIIMLVSQSSPDLNPATNCMLRFFESAVGAAIGVSLLWVIEQWNRLRSGFKYGFRRKN